MNIVIVLGRKLTNTGKPTIILKKRMKTAITLFKKLEEPKLMILSGGIPHEYSSKRKTFPTEAEVMFNLLGNLRDKIAEKVILEPNSATTVDNFINTEQIIQAISKTKKIKNVYLVTSDFHMERSLILSSIYLTIKNIIPVVSKYNKKFEKQKEETLIEELNSMWV